MSDANVDLNASALHSVFTTTAGFYPQDSGTERTMRESIALGADGDRGCSHVYDKGHEYSNRYKYCGTALTTALGAAATAFGKVDSGKVWTEMDIEFSAEGDREAVITLRGHDHDTNMHSSTTNPPHTFDVSGLIPAGAGRGVPNLLGGTIVNTSCSPISGRLSFSMNHIDKVGADGAHFTGDQITCRVEASLDFEGVCGTEGGVTAGWLQAQQSTSDANEDLDSSSMTAHQYVDHS